jgi:hydroxyacid-oxoacid transhydrogenase
MHAKTGIAHRRLRPTLGIVDPLNSHSMPAMVTASAGFDVLCHALESYTAIPSTSRPMPPRPSLRPAYQGSNPFSDIWAEMAIRMVARSLARAVEHPEDAEARAEMSLAATYAGIGFGNAGVHLPHGMSYAVAGQVRAFHSEGYPDDHAMVPHGMSVVLTAPAVFRFTAAANPERHLQAAEALGADVTGVKAADAGRVLADRITWFMQRLRVPNGLAAVGYSQADIPSLVEGTLPQHRVTKLSPRPAGPEELGRLFEDAMQAW